MSNSAVISAISREIPLTTRQKADFFQQELQKTAVSEPSSRNLLLKHCEKLQNAEDFIKESLSDQKNAILQRVQERKNRFARPQSVPPQKSEKTAKIAEQSCEKTPVFNKSKRFRSFFLAQVLKKIGKASSFHGKAAKVPVKAASFLLKSGKTKAIYP